MDLSWGTCKRLYKSLGLSRPSVPPTAIGIKIAKPAPPLLLTLFPLVPLHPSCLSVKCIRRRYFFPSLHRTIVTWCRPMCRAVFPFPYCLSPRRCDVISMATNDLPRMASRDLDASCKINTRPRSWRCAMCAGCEITYCVSVCRFGCCLRMHWKFLILETRYL